MRRAAALVNVETIRMIEFARDLGTEFVEHRRGNLVGSAVSGIDINLHPLEVDLAGNRRLAELDITAGRVIETHRFAETAAVDTLRDSAFKLLLDFRLNVVRQLHAFVREKLDAVVAVGVMRRADHDTRSQTQGLREIGDSRRGNRAAEHDINTCTRKAGLQTGFQHVTRNPGVLSDQHRGVLIRGMLREDLTGRIADAHNKIRNNREGAYRTAHAIRTKVFTRHKTS